MKRTKKYGRKLIKYLIVFMVPIVCMFIHMYLRKCYPFGDNTILIGDANAQYYWFEKMMLEKIKNGESILFSWQAGMGFEFYQNFFYYLGSPFNIIAMIIGNWDMELGVVLTMIVQIGMCSVTMLYYLGHTSRNIIKLDEINTPICMAFAVAYSMCDYVIGYQHNYIWIISLMLAPLVMLGVERIVEKNACTFYIVCLTLTFITNFYFAWFVCVLSFFWYVDCCRGTFRQVVKMTGKYLLSSFWSAVMAAFVLVPCYLAVRGRYTIEDYASVSWDRNGDVAKFVYGFLWGSPINRVGKGFFNYNNYVGITVIMLVVLYFFNRNIPLHSRIKRFIEIAVLAIALNCMVGIFIFHGFSFTNGYSSRFAFILSIILLITSFEEVINVDKKNYAACACALFLLGVMITVGLLEIDEVGDIWIYIGSVFIGVLCIICFVIFNRKSINVEQLRCVIVILLLLEIISNYFIVIGSGYEISDEKEEYTKEWIGEYDDLELEPGERKTSWMGSQFGMGNSDTSIFSSVISKEMMSLFKSTGLNYNGSAYAYKGTTPVTDMMFNVKYVLTNHEMYYGGYKCIDTEDMYITTPEDDGENGIKRIDIEEAETSKNSDILKKDSENTRKKITYGIYENEYANGLGFVVNENIKDWKIDGDNPFEVQNNFIEETFGVKGIFEKVGINDLNVYQFGCEQVDSQGESVTYRNIWPKDGIFYSANTFTFTVNETAHMYMYVRDDRDARSTIQIDDKPFLDDEKYFSPGTMIDLGNVRKGQKISLRVDNRSLSTYTGTTSFFLYKYNSDKMKNVMRSASVNKLKVNQIKTASVIGEVETKCDGVLYTSIPYYKGSKVYVDGKEADMILISGALCGVNVTAGKHEIVFKYFPYGLKIGLIISIMGIVGSLVYFKNSRVRKIEYEEKRM